MTTSNQKMFTNISNRELEVIALITNEYSTREIAQLLFIGVETVKTHRKNIRRKLKAKNVAGVVRTALQYQLISFTQSNAMAS